MTTSNSNGSQTAVISTEHTLGTITTSGSFVIGIDANAMALGDELIVRAKLKVRSVGTTRLAYEATYSHVQNEPVILSIPVASTNGSRNRPRFPLGNLGAIENVIKT